MSCKNEHVVSDKVRQTRRQSLEQVMGLSLRSLTALPTSHFPAPPHQSPLGNKLVLMAQTFQPSELWEDARSLIFSVSKRRLMKAMRIFRKGLDNSRSGLKDEDGGGCTLRRSQEGTPVPAGGPGGGRNQPFPLGAGGGGRAAVPGRRDTLVW